MTFANVTTTYPQHTVKLGMRIENWPFRSLRNNLAIVLETNASADATKCQRVRSISDETGNLKWFTVNVEGVSMYLGSFFLSFSK